MERTFLLFPGTEKRIVIHTAPYLEKLDVGLDFDIPRDVIELRVTSGGRHFKAIKMAGTFMPLVACNIPVRNQKITITIRHISLAKSAWAALRVSRSISKMCAPTTPIWDDYMVRRDPW